MMPNLGDLMGRDVTGIIHVGAHMAQEMHQYFQLGADKILWYEANPAIASEVSKMVHGDPRQAIRNLAVSNFCGRVKFNVETTNGGQSSSILDLKLHTKYYPHVQYSYFVEVDCVTLDSEGLTGYNALFTDAQGSDFDILRGAEKLLSTSIKYVYTEIFTEELYAGCGLLGDVDKYMSSLGFRRIGLSDTSFGWGDAFYIKS